MAKLTDIVASAWRAMANSFASASTQTRDLAAWNPSRLSADSDILPDWPKMVARSRDLDRNDGIASGAIQTIVDNVAGTGFRLSARPNYVALGKPKSWADGWSRATEALFYSWYWSTECHAGDSLTGDQITSIMLRGSLTNGESLALPLWLPERGDWATKIQLVEADRLSQPAGRPATAAMRGGIEFDAFGAPIAYHFSKRHPGDHLGDGGGLQEWERVPRRTDFGRLRVLHVFDPERPEQSRGVPILAAVLPEFKQAGRYAKAELDAAVANALIAAIIETPLDPVEVAEMLKDPKSPYLDGWSKHSVTMGSSLVAKLYPGEKLNSFNPGRPATSFDPFMSAVYRRIGVRLGLSQELLLRDFTKSNYSSARAALLECWRSFNRRRDWLGTTWLDRIYALWLEEAVNAGRVDAPDFYANRAAYQRCRWIGPGRGWVDPVKEAQAAQIRIDAGLSTYEDECAEQGRDWREVFEQQSFELAERKRLNLPDHSAARAGNPVQSKPNDDEDPADAPTAPEKKNGPGGTGAAAIA